LSGLVSLLEKVMPVLLAVKECSGFLPSRRVLGRAVTACAIKDDAIKAGAGS
jgi:hypothetical protein